MIQRYNDWNESRMYKDSEGKYVLHSDHVNHIVEINKKVERYEDFLSDIHDFSNSLKEMSEQYSKSQNVFYIYKGLIKRVDKIIKKCEASK